MHEGHEADAYQSLVRLNGIFNRLGDGKGSPLKCDPPAWTTRKVKPVSKEEIGLARDLFKSAVGKGA